MKKLVIAILIVLMVSQSPSVPGVLGRPADSDEVDSVEIVVAQMIDDYLSYDGRLYVSCKYQLAALVKNEDGYLLDDKQFQYTWKIFPNQVATFDNPDNNFIDIFINNPGFCNILVFIEKDGVQVGFGKLYQVALPARYLYYRMLSDDMDCTKKCDNYPCRIVFDDKSDDIKNGLYKKKYKRN